ncbi:UNVERIFIED_CONTAM: hypothetical protein K2H54_058032 [Gekko kuhli]
MPRSPGLIGDGLLDDLHVHDLDKDLDLYDLVGVVTLKFLKAFMLLFISCSTVSVMVWKKPASSKGDSNVAAEPSLFDIKILALGGVNVNGFKGVE